MKLELGPEIISSYKRLAYETWYALAEFVDNATQAYFNNRTLLDRVYASTGDKLTVDITSGADGRGEFVRIKDNSIGMSEAELKAAVYIGNPHWISEVVQDTDWASRLERAGLATYGASIPPNWGARSAILSPLMF